jgi:hypothetical protein
MTTSKARLSFTALALAAAAGFALPSAQAMPALGFHGTAPDGILAGAPVVKAEHDASNGFPPPPDPGQQRGAWRGAYYGRGGGEQGPYGSPYYAPQRGGSWCAYHPRQCR